MATEAHHDAKGRAVEAWRQTRYEEALEAANEAIGTNRQSEVLYRFRSTLARRLGRYEQAATDADKAVEVNPRGPQNYHCQAVILQQQRKLPQAGASYLTAMSTSA
eukprot:6300971-Prymnesium_polylepis.1